MKVSSCDYFNINLKNTNQLLKDRRFYIADQDNYPYAKGKLLTISGWDTRMVANEKDTMGLLFISGISKK